MNNKFTPTWLYIKQHNDTGLKYFGKTIGKDPIKYRGSGKHWIRHIKKHSNNISTLWYQLFTDRDQLIEYALKFSQENNIVESAEWANLKDETGVDGGSKPGRKLSIEHKQKISAASKNKPKTEEHKQKLRKPKTEEHKQKIANTKKGKQLSEEHKQKIAIAMKGKSSPNLGKVTSIETRLKMSNSRKKGNI